MAPRIYGDILRAMNTYGKKALELRALLERNGIKSATGSIKFELLNVNVDVSDKSSVGTLLQEWLGVWMDDKKFFYRSAPNSQIPPDFYLGSSNETDLLEVKAFDYSKTPNFDIANFDAYVRSLQSDAYRLDADYLIFGYELKKGKISIKDMWLKKIWEISCSSGSYAIKTQTKQKVIVNIRPFNFKSKNYRGAYPAFKTRKDFVIALKDTIGAYRQDQDAAEQWLELITDNYKKFTSQSL